MATYNSSDFINEFSFKLYKQLAKNPGNFFISPFSISVSLSMCLAGARAETYTQLKQLLCHSEEDSNEKIMQSNKSLLDVLNLFSTENLSLKIANKIFVKENYQILNEFVKDIKNFYDSEVENINFEDSKKSAATMNNWISNKTNDKIKNLIDENILDHLTRLILINAIYFKANWLNEFQESLTDQEDFHLSDGSTVKVDMMKICEKFNYLSNPDGLNANVCRLPYVGNEISMTLILPNENTSLDQIENNLNSSSLKSILLSNRKNAKLALHLPKFKLEHKVELSEDLVKLGAGLAFDRYADFTGIYPIRELHISKVVHQAVVEVNEKGTEAAAATYVKIVKLTSTRIQEPIVDFKCNRPFLFIIHDNTNNTVLFIGRYIQP